MNGNDDKCMSTLLSDYKINDNNRIGQTILAFLSLSRCSGFFNVCQSMSNIL